MSNFSLVYHDLCLEHTELLVLRPLVALALDPLNPGEVFNLLIANQVLDIALNFDHLVERLNLIIIAFILM